MAEALQGLVLHGIFKGVGRVREFDDGTKVANCVMDTGRLYPEPVSIPEAIAKTLKTGEYVALPVYPKAGKDGKVYLRYQTPKE